MSDALNFLSGALMVASLALLIALFIERLYWFIYWLIDATGGNQ